MNRSQTRDEPTSAQQPKSVSISGKLLALDVSETRIGIAVCDPLQWLARPLTVLERKNRRQDFDALAEFVHAEEAQAVVCGLPLNMDGSEGDQTRMIRKWAMRLAYALRILLGHPVPIVFWDERLSTFAAREIAESESIAAGEDAIAAAVILQRYLDRNQTQSSSDFGCIVLPVKATQSSTESGESLAI